jgi:RNA polymerase sigma-70 factor (ECF subfamily)
MQEKKLHLEDKKNIHKILNGDKDAFGTILEKYKKLVFHIVFRIVMNNCDREDICQEIFLKVYQHLPRFQYRSKLSTWIAKIAHNTCLNHLQKRDVQLFRRNNKIEQAWENMTYPDHSPAEQFEVNELSSRLNEEISHLPVHYRTILTLYHHDGMSYSEIGEITNLPAGTVKNYLFRARKILKSQLIEKYQLEELI